MRMAVAVLRRRHFSSDWHYIEMNPGEYEFRQQFYMYAGTNVSSSVQSETDQKVVGASYSHADALSEALRKQGTM